MDPSKLQAHLSNMLAIQLAIDHTVREVGNLLGRLNMIGIDEKQDPYDSLTGGDHVEAQALHDTLATYKVSMITG
jgi:hypothetical protein